MLNALIRFSLGHRAAVILAAAALVVFGWDLGRRLPVEVLPDLTRPTVTILTEAPGLAPEEIELLVTVPVESSVQGVTGLERLRSSSDVGLSLVFAEFAWGTDIYRARQLVQERLQTVRGTLPAGVEPALTPISSLMGEILLVGLSSENEGVSQRDLRILADWTVRRRLQSIPGVAEVLTIGAGVGQIQVQPDLYRLAAHEVSLDELESALRRATGVATSGYLQTGSREVMVRGQAMTTRLEELGSTVVKAVGDRRVLVRDVAEVVHDIQDPRGDAAVNGRPGVILSVDKAPGFDTLRVTAAIEQALEDLRGTLPDGVNVEVLFRQGDFIETAFANLKMAIRDGALMVAAVLFLFLLSARTTFITLTAIPLSFAITLLTFAFLGVSVNSMTLGGMAVAIGMVVDDAIVDVENVYRRLRENLARPEPRPRLEVIAAASGEVRNSILYATLLVILVFLPLIGLQAVEGRLFRPIAIATMTSMAASFVVSLTVIPVLASILIHPRARANKPAAGDTWVAGWLKRGFLRVWLRPALEYPWILFGLTSSAAVGAVVLYATMPKGFLPSFNEGSATVTLVSAPGTSLREANEAGQVADGLLHAIPEIRSVGRRAGRAERDDHVMPVSVNEFDVELHPGGRPREQVFEEIRRRLSAIPGALVTVGQPIGHRLDHMLSGVSSPIAVKLFGPDLEVLRAKGREIEALARRIGGMTDIHLERQVTLPQLRIEVDRERAQSFGVQPGALNEQVSALLGGKLMAELREGERTIDLVLRLPRSWREDLQRLAELPVEIGIGQRIPLGLVAQIREATGPNVIQREHGQRRIVLGARAEGGDLEARVEELQSRVRDEVRLPEGYRVQFEGEYQAQKDARQRIVLLSAGVLGLIAVLLLGYFRVRFFVAQVFVDLPLALMGGLFLTWLLVDQISIATLVGFIAVAGIASRNSIMLISHYLHLMRHEGESFSRRLVERGTLERLVPVLMTALSAGAALVPLVLASDEPGTEILHPVAVVICGGLVTSTLLGLGVTPAMFLLWGGKAARHAQERNAPAIR